MFHIANLKQNIDKNLGQHKRSLQLFLKYSKHSSTVQAKRQRMYFRPIDFQESFNKKKKKYLSELLKQSQSFKKTFVLSNCIKKKNDSARNEVYAKINY